MSIAETLLNELQVFAWLNIYGVLLYLECTYIILVSVKCKSLK